HEDFLPFGRLLELVRELFYARTLIHLLIDALDEVYAIYEHENEDERAKHDKRIRFGEDDFAERNHREHEHEERRRGDLHVKEALADHGVRDARNERQHEKRPVRHELRIAE